MSANSSLPPVNPYETPMEAGGHRLRPSPGVSYWDRFHVLGIGICVGMLIAIPFAIEPATSSFQFAQWARIMAGPLSAVLHGEEVLGLIGFIGGLFAVMHPIVPRGWTAWLTTFGLFLWFWSGCVGLAL